MPGIMNSEYPENHVIPRTRNNNVLSTANLQISLKQLALSYPAINNCGTNLEQHKWIVIPRTENVDKML